PKTTIGTLGMFILPCLILLGLWKRLVIRSYHFFIQDITVSYLAKSLTSEIPRAEECRGHSHILHDGLTFSIGKKIGAGRSTRGYNERPINTPEEGKGRISLTYPC